MLCTHLRASGSFKPFSLAMRTCKFCWSTASCNCNLLVMAHEVHPFCGCFLLISPSKLVKSLASHCLVAEGDGMDGYFLPLLILYDILQLNLWWRMEYQVTYFVSPWIGVVFFTRMVCNTAEIFGTPVEIVSCEWEEECIKFSLAKVFCDLRVDFSGGALARIVEHCAIKNMVQYIHCT